ncbi:MAG: imidazole glycerol phosphate synthase subunit HisH [Candidatus Neomarinimicrobiota bacterium]|jgi:glutamine amidotransferase|nr:imidazole glycerol phosphate synthase subunit HisH [Candidatus Neomarinimicrobiota bacterium]MDD3966077.1 imidazole glycerol phosphate synthase subunit HisH [Candidatus Neomarinimicrobiota bacterium]MDX9780365.1 imidazole glycerol phosphate synthase subunit HisH [bacterium]
MSLIVIKYNAGNIRSVLIALERLGVTAQISDDPGRIRAAEKVIFPGVGEASSAMRYLREKKLDTLIFALKQPVLGICLGLQLMCAHSEEGDTQCLNVFSTRVRRFPPEQKVPHMGWNAIHGLRGPLFKGIPENAWCYFVHSYAAECCAEQTAQTEYIFSFAAALQKDNFFALQFHPEKSGDTGQRILRNFLELPPIQEGWHS